MTYDHKVNMHLQLQQLSRCGISQYFLPEQCVFFSNLQYASSLAPARQVPLLPPLLESGIQARHAFEPQGGCHFSSC